MFFLRAVQVVSGRTRRRRRARIVDLTRAPPRSAGRRSWDAAREQASVLLQSPLPSARSSTLPEARELLGVTYQAANNLVTRLEAMGVLEEVTGQTRHRVFRYSEYTDLFAEGPGAPVHTQPSLEYGGP